LTSKTDNRILLFNVSRSKYSYDSYQRLIQVSRSDGTHDDYTYDTYSVGAGNGYGTSAFTSQYAW